MNQNLIRPIAICLCSYQKKILVIEWFGKIKQEKFYRPPGGGIEFGEFGKEALFREFLEEFYLELTDIKFLFFLENIFVYEGRKGHEILFVFDAHLKQKDLYDTILSGHECDGSHFDAYWLSLDEINQENCSLYPDGLSEKLIELQYLIL